MGEKHRPSPPPRDFREILRIETREQAIAAIERWTYNEMVAYPNEGRVELAKYLVEKVGAQELPVPTAWIDMIQNPGKFDELHADMVGEIDIEPLRFDNRPTADSERDLAHLADR